jgi:23S rRNA (uracil1939-C5)-methyltransferase
VEDFLLQYKKNEVSSPDTIVIDPPRDGLHPSALETIRSFAPRVLVYVSCNPATLARDLGFLLQDNQFRLTDIMPVDMFPHTHHIETIVRLEHR